MKKLTALFLVAASALALAGCDEGTPSATQRERQATAVVTAQAAVTVGMPAIKNFAEKRQLKAIYELRDQANLATYTYTLDLNGKRHKVCPTNSVGFGIPYATQFTNPQTDIFYGTSSQQHMAMPQADPNALFSPASADGTWVICINPKNGEMAPTFVEPRIVTYTFEMPSVD